MLSSSRGLQLSGAPSSRAQPRLAAPVSAPARAVRVAAGRTGPQPAPALGRRRRRMSGAATPASRRLGDGDSERAPLFSGETSPMGTLKHRAAGGSLPDVTAPALADERGGGAAAAAAGGTGLSPAVLLCVAVASMGAFAFGYHLGVVNGPLDALSTQLGFGGDAFRQGLVSAGLGLAWALGGRRDPPGSCS